MMMPDGFDAYTCATCEHSQRDHWSASRRDNNRSYCNEPDCDCYHFVMKRPAESTCHCGRPVAALVEFGVYANINMTHDFCGRCISVRCDAFPGACMPLSVDARPGGVHTLPLDGVHTPGVD